MDRGFRDAGRIRSHRLPTSRSPRRTVWKYEIPAEASMGKILALVTIGGAHYNVTIAEKLSTALAIERTEFLTSEMPTEGSLLPETYSFSRGETYEELLEGMQAVWR